MMKRTCSGTVGILLVIAPVACGSSSSAGSANTVTIAQPSHGLHILPLDVAIAEGFFKKEGITVKVRMVNGDATAIPALVSGSVDLAQDTTTPVLIADTKGSGLQILAAMSGPPAQIVLAKPVADRLGITANTPIAKRVAALKGHKIAVNDIGGGLQYTLDSVLKKYGVDPNSVPVVAIQPYTAELSALRRSRVDAIAPVTPYGTAAVSGGYGVAVADVFDGAVPTVSTAPFSVIDAKASWITSHQKLAQGVRRAIKDALDYIRSNPAGAAGVAAKNFPSLAPSVLASAIKAGAYPPDTDISSAEYQTAAGIAAYSNQKAATVPFTNAVWAGARR